MALVTQKRKYYCISCGERFRMKDRRLVSRKRAEMPEAHYPELSR
jgi:hypothetical protein